MKYSIVTFGCRVNQADSLGFEEQLLASGARPAPAESADVIVVNTCSVTASADQGARQTIRRIARVNPQARIVVTGCYATRDRDQVAQLPSVAQVVCNDAKPQLLTFVRSVSEEPSPWTPGRETTTATRFGDGDGGCGATIEPGIGDRTAFTLRVQTGCSQPCSYCIIPATRGAPRSAPLADLLTEVGRIRLAGFREVVLTGVHLGSYGRDLAPAQSLAALLTALRDRFGSDSDGGAAVLFRVSSLEPMDCTPDIVALVRDSSCFAPHFHLPLQHASRRMLQSMRRPYDLDHYASLVAGIREAIPNASIGSDVIVGFPGESEADFEVLVRYLEHSPLTHVHVFPYSDRPGTPASKMGDRPAGIAVKARGARLRQIGSALTRRFVESQVGLVHRALTLGDGTLVVTGNYLKVRIAPGIPRNQWVDVRITAREPELRGEVVPRDAVSRPV